MTRSALLLDLDGTVVDTLPFLFETFRHALEPFVHRIPTDAEIVAAFGPPERGCLATVLARPDLGKVPLAECLDQATLRFHEYYERGHRERVRFFAGIPEAIELARSLGWRLGVFTGKGRRSAVYTVEQLGWSDVIECIVSGEDVARTKPDPEGVRLAMDLLNTRKMIYVGDMAVDVAAGRGAGAKTIGANWGSFEPAKLKSANPDWLLDRVSDLEPVLRAPPFNAE
jgi:pyrophosphatase PpaX